MNFINRLVTFWLKVPAIVMEGVVTECTPAQITLTAPNGNILVINDDPKNTNIACYKIQINNEEVESPAIPTPFVLPSKSNITAKEFQELDTESLASLKIMKDNQWKKQLAKELKKPHADPNYLDKKQYDYPSYFTAQHTTEEISNNNRTSQRKLFRLPK
jgi:hypothetical protein